VAVIAERLADRRVVVTGATGFLGTALVERLLRSVPGCQVTVLVRPGRRSSAAARARRDILGNDCFDRLRSELGDRFDAEVASRLRAVPGDVGHDPVGPPETLEALRQADVVIHSAATVSFDAPLDAAVEVNLLGPSRVAAVLAPATIGEESSGRARADETAGSDAGHKPHLVAVSTAYVAGSRRGRAAERPVDTGLFAVAADWREEVEAARRLRSDLEAESRRPAVLAACWRAARAELGAAGTPILATRAEKERDQWVKDRLIEAGRARARSLGWPDAYAYTKALGELALFETAAGGGLPVTIVRPSIIESALAEPRPGWIRGFRMAEPVIISYARGLLAQFPGVPEGIIDVIPVDLVVAAILAVAASDPPVGEPRIVQVASGSRNPLRYGQLVDLVQGWFGEHPVYDAKGQPIVVPSFSFPGRGRVQRQLDRATRTLTAAERALAALPLRGSGADLSARLEDRRLQVERAQSYVELYGAYAECEALYEIDGLLGLLASLPEEDRVRFPADPAIVDWSHYVREIHLPSVVEHARVRTSPRVQPGPDRAERARRAILAPERHLAAFDLENTLIAANVVDSYAWLASRHLDGRDRVALVGSLLAEGPSLLALDRRDRADFLRFFYRRYEGADSETLERDSLEMLTTFLLARAYPAGLARVRAHRAAGHVTVLITGAISQVVRPLAPLFDVLVAAEVTIVDGRLTGHLEETPPTGESRAQVLADLTDRLGLELAESVAYADSTSDLPMLEAVGFPVAVNPETKLAAQARRRGWHVEHWSRAPGSQRLRLPLAPVSRPSRRSVLGALLGR